MVKYKTIYKNGVRSQGEPSVLLEAVTATGYSPAIPVGLFSAVKLNILASAVTSGGTFKVWVSDELEAPDFTAAIAVDNWYQQQAVIDTGATTVDPILDITIDANGTKSYEINTNGANWICVELDARTDGTYSAKTSGYNL